MASVLKISDGTTTVDFLASTVYRVTSWQPAVAVRRSNDLGGRGPYNDVVEEMLISIKASTPLVSLATLQDLLDQAARWGRGEPVDAVLLHYKPTAISEELHTVIIGPAGDAPMVELPAGFALSSNTGMLDGVLIRFVRTGLWFGAEETYESGSASTMPVAMPVAVPDLNPIGYPVKLRLEGITDWTADAHNSFILMSSAPGSDVSYTRIKILGATVFNSTTDGFSAYTDTANKPANGSTVLRYTSSTTAARYSATWSASNIDADVRRWGVFINYRNNHATTAFKVRMSFIGAGNISYTPYLHIPGGVGNPTMAYIGVATINDAFTGVQLELTADAATGTVDFDIVALIALDSPRLSRVIAIGDSNVSTSLAADDLIIDHRLLSHLTPLVYFDESTDIIMPYRGDATIFLSDVYPYFAWLAVGGSENPTHWRPSDGTTVYTNKWYVMARTAYLIPE